jgi:hypothetical protein
VSTLNTLERFIEGPKENYECLERYPTNFLRNENENGASKPAFCKLVKGENSQEAYRAEGRSEECGKELSVGELGQ